MDIHELSEFWRKEALEWKRLQQASVDKYNDAVRELASALGLDPEQTSMEQVVKRVREVMGSCTWILADEDSNVWDTSCGGAFIMEVDTPEDNEMHYCPYCGKHLVQVIPEEEASDE